MKGSIISGAIHGFLAVALGAFAAHALEDLLDDYSAGIWDTAIQYQMFHAAALILVGILMSKAIFGEVKQLKIAMFCFNAGIVFFGRKLNGVSINRNRYTRCHYSYWRGILFSGPDYGYNNSSKKDSIKSVAYTS